MPSVERQSIMVAKNTDSTQMARDGVLVMPLVSSVTSDELSQFCVPNLTQGPVKSLKILVSS